MLNQDDIPTQPVRRPRNYRVTARLGSGYRVFLLHAEEVDSRDEAMHVVRERLVRDHQSWTAASFEIEMTHDRRIG